MTDPHAGATAAVIPLRRRCTATRCGPVKTCPVCHTVLDGGPILFDCPSCERTVRAADIDTEFHAATTGRAAA